MRRMIFSMAAAGLFALTAAPAGAQQAVRDPDGGLIATTPSDLPFYEEGVRYQTQALTRNPRAQDWIKYVYVKCDVRWNEKCEGNYDIDAPAGWQACKPLFNVAGLQQGAGYEVRPGSWYTNDPESPDRFRRYSYHIWAKGSGNLFDQWGSKVELTRVGIRIIPAAATNAQRYAEGCEMPDHN